MGGRTSNQQPAGSLVGRYSKSKSITKKSDMIEQKRGSGGEHRR